MSRVGKAPIKVSQGVKVEVKDGVVRVEGPKGKLSHKLPRGVGVKVENRSVNVSRDEEIVPNAGALQGLTRTLISNMVHGVHTGFSRELDIVGVGYRAATKGTTLSMTLGYSHAVDYTLPAGITAKVENNTHLVIS